MPTQLNHRRQLLKKSNKQMAPSKKIGKKEFASKKGNRKNHKFSLNAESYQEAKMSQSNNHQKGIFISTFSIYEQKFCKRILKIHRNLRLGGKCNHNKTRTDKVKRKIFVYWRVSQEISHGKTLSTSRPRHRICLKLNYQQSDWKI